MDPPPTAAEGSTGGSNGQRPKRRRNKPKPLLVDPLLPLWKFENLNFHAFCKSRDCCELARKEDLLKQRVEVTAAVSDACLRYLSPSRAMNFVTSRGLLLFDLSEHNKECLKWLNENFDEYFHTEVVDPKTYVQIYLRIQEFELLVEEELVALVQYQDVIEIGILAYPAPARIGQAYLATLADILALPSGGVEYVELLDQIGRKYFSGLIRNMYTPAKDTPEYDAPVEADELEMQWCPVTHAWHKLDSTAVVRFLPFPFEEPGIASIYRRPKENGWKVFWGFGNGMVMLSSIKDHLDQNRIVIVPDEKSTSGRKLIVLDDSLLDQPSYPHGPRFRDLHNTNLIFKTVTRPQLDNLYLKCLVILARRRRCHNDATENAKIDLKKVPMHQLWKFSFEKQRKRMIDYFGFEPADFEWVIAKECHKVDGRNLERGDGCGDGASCLAYWLCHR